MDESRQLELYEFLRTSFRVDMVMDTEYECGREYATCSTTISLRHPVTGEWQSIADDYASVCINRD